MDIDSQNGLVWKNVNFHKMEIEPRLYIWYDPYGNFAR